MIPILYSNYNCPHSLKAAFFLSEKGIDFQRVEVDLSSREQKTSAYLEKNPLGTVPAYEDDDLVMGDSLAIMRYLDAASESQKLFPDNPDDLAYVLAWIERGDTDFWDVSHHLYWQLIEIPNEGTDWDEVARLKSKGRQLLRELEAILSQQAFISGMFSAADIAIMPWVYGYQRFDLVDNEQFPHVAAWCDTLSQRDSFKDNYQVKGIPFQVVLTAEKAV